MINKLKLLFLNNYKFFLVLALLPVLFVVIYNLNPELVKAQSELPETVLTESRSVIVLREFFVFLMIVLAILMLLLMIGIIGVYKNLKKMGKMSDNFSLMMRLLLKDPAAVFSRNATRDERGTYGISFDKHKRYHDFTKQNVKRIIGIIIFSILIVGVLSISVNHSTKAKSINNNSISGVTQ